MRITAYRYIFIAKELNLYTEKKIDNIDPRTNIINFKKYKLRAEQFLDICGFQVKIFFVRQLSHINLREKICETKK
jgi:hypothetical protein